MSALRKIRRAQARLGTQKFKVVCPRCKKVIGRGRTAIGAAKRRDADEPCATCSIVEQKEVSVEEKVAQALVTDSEPLDPAPQETAATIE